jgi:hypothetical protein
LRHQGRVFYECSFSIHCLPFVLLRQKGGVFLVLDQECIFNRSSDFVPEWPKGEFVSFIGYILLTKSLPCKVAALYRVAVLIQSLQMERALI